MRSTAAGSAGERECTPEPTPGRVAARGITVGSGASLPFDREIHGDHAPPARPQNLPRRPRARRRRAGDREHRRLRPERRRLPRPQPATAAAPPTPGPGSAGPGTPAPTGGAASGPPGSAPSGKTWERVNLGFVSAYLLIRGGEAALVDTGEAGSEAAIESSLTSIGLGWSAVGHVIITHNHGDHSGSSDCRARAGRRSDRVCGRRGHSGDGRRRAGRRRRRRSRVRSRDHHDARPHRREHQRPRLGERRARGGRRARHCRGPTRSHRARGSRRTWTRRSGRSSSSAA